MNAGRWILGGQIQQSSGVEGVQRLMGREDGFGSERYLLHHIWGESDNCMRARDHNHHAMHGNRNHFDRKLKRGQLAGAGGANVIGSCGRQGLLAHVGSIDVTGGPLDHGVGDQRLRLKGSEGLRRRRVTWIWSHGILSLPHGVLRNRGLCGV